MSVHLVNPSDNSFGTAVITPRWLFVIAAATPRIGAIPSSSTSRSNRSFPRASMPETSSASASTPATRCAAMRWAAWRASEAHGWSTAAFMPRCIPKKHSKWARPTPLSKAMATSPGAKVRQRLASPATPERIYEGGRIEGSEFLRRALGPDEPGQVYVGLRADHSRMPEALLVLQRLAHRRAEAAPAQLPERDR